MDNHKTDRRKLTLPKSIEETGKIARYKARVIRNVDFQRVEEAPLNDFERDVQKKIAKEPQVLRSLIAQEESSRILRVLDESGLSGRQKQCVRLTLEGMKVSEIASVLRIRNSDVHLSLKHGIERLRKVLGQSNLI